MSSKHEGAPWYRSQLGIDSQLPTTLFKVTNPSSTVTAMEEPVETTVPVLDQFVSDVPETDTLEFVLDIEEELPDDPVAGPEPPSTRQGINIDSLTVTDLKELSFLPVIFVNTIILGEGLGWAITDEMTLKHTSLQLSLHPRTKVQAYPPPPQRRRRWTPS